MFVDMKALICPLPEHILKQIHSGNTSQALRAIDDSLASPKTPPMIKSRLEIEKERILRTPYSYPHDEATALSMLQELNPAYHLADLHHFCAQGLIDWCYIDHKPMYFVRFLKSLTRTHANFAALAGTPLDPKSSFLDPVIELIQQQGKARYHIKIKGRLDIEEKAFIPGEQYTIHVPIPCAAAQTSNIHLSFPGLEPANIDEPAAGQRTACWQVTLHENQPIFWEYEYDQTIYKIDFSTPPKSPIYSAPAPVPEDLGEHLPHIRFTPYLKALAGALTGNEKDPLTIARIFYDYITTQVQYAFMPEYFLIESIAEYTAANQRGDCGLQALLFITLCRIAGIPARWQSGLSIDDQYVGAHDWAQFYIKPWGWLFCDCSFGGSAYRKGNMTRWNHYFAHLDPFRMVANHQFQGDFAVAKKHWRVDPYDNQTGECECSQKAFTACEFDVNYTLAELKKI